VPPSHQILATPLLLRLSKLQSQSQTSLTLITQRSLTGISLNCCSGCLKPALCKCHAISWLQQQLTT